MNLLRPVRAVGRSVLIACASLRFFLSSTVRFFHKPSYPNLKKGKVLLHLGCGDIDDKCSINVDARAWRHVHHVQDVTNLSKFPSGYADMIYACMVLEHIPKDKSISVLKEWKRVLKPGGVLRLSVPDFDAMLHVYADNRKDIASIINPLMGGQGYGHNYHFNVFTRSSLSHLLKDAGFCSVRSWDAKTAPTPKA